MPLIFYTAYVVVICVLAYVAYCETGKSLVAGLAVLGVGIAGLFS